MIKPKVDKLVAKHTRQMESFTSLKRIFKKKKMFEIWPESGRGKGEGGYSYMNAGQLCWWEFEEAMSQPKPVLCEQYMEASLWSC